MTQQALNISGRALIYGASIILVIGTIIWRKYRSTQKNSVPSKWQRVGELSELIMYPLKSGQAVNVEEAVCTELGLRTTERSPKELHNLRDRFFLVYKEENGAFITCRTQPALLQVKITSVSDKEFIFGVPDMKQLVLKLQECLSVQKKVTMWFGEEIEAVDCGDEAAKWISTYLKQEDSSLRIGHYSPKSPNERRPTDLPPWDNFKKFYRKLRDDDTGAFSDLASYMLLSDSSLADLKTKLPSHLQHIKASQFRPNLVVKGTKPYEEDNWDWIKIGESVVMRGFKPCTRCMVTTIDPETGHVDPHLEPLRTLKTYRQVKHPEQKKLEGNAPIMGLYCGLYVEGLVKTGDPVYVGLK